ncbi:MAG TPA: SUKH-3 domain-containing protein [Actinoplanes sp.]|jgi:hypothetical protein|nr:SUKH-3 domain-containing protein [Actinoplanes sp.]
MITRVEAEAIAARWARGEAEQRGYGCEPAIAEFDLGWVIWTRPPPGVLPLPGDGARTVIDRETGALSTWPAIPYETIAALYRTRRPRPSATVDPAVALRRAARRRPSPTTAAEVFVEGRVFRAQGAKGDQQINLHPRVAAALAGLPSAARVRGADRHAEIIAVSDALHETGKVGGGFRAFRVREKADPDAGGPAPPCETCRAVLVDLGALPRSELTYASEWRPATDQIAGRFPPDVAQVLADGGWLGVESPDVPAIDAASTLSGRPAFPAARRALAEFAGVRCARRGPGRQRAIRPLTFDPLPGAGQAGALAEFAEVLGVPVFPLGVEAGDSYLVIDEPGRVFLLDQAGEWFVGASLDEAVVALLTGDGPAERLHDDGTWASA